MCRYANKTMFTLCVAFKFIQLEFYHHQVFNQIRSLSSKMKSEVLPQKEVSEMGEERTNTFKAAEIQIDLWSPWFVS